MSAETMYHMDDVVLSLPAGFVDRTLHVLEWPIDGGRVVLIVQRERLGAGRSFADYVAREIKAYPSRFLGFTPEPPPRADFDWGFATSHHCFRWKKDEDVLYHHQVFVDAAPLVLVLTATGKAAHRESVDEITASALANLKFRED